MQNLRNILRLSLGWKCYTWIFSALAKETDTIKNRLSEMDRNCINSFCILKMLPKRCLSSVRDICITLISCLTLSSNRTVYILNNTWNGNVHIFSMIYIFLWKTCTVFSCFTGFDNLYVKNRGLVSVTCVHRLKKSMQETCRKEAS